MIDIESSFNEAIRAYTKECEKYDTWEEDEDSNIDQEEQLVMSICRTQNQVVQLAHALHVMQQQDSISNIEVMYQRINSMKRDIIEMTKMFNKI